MNLFNIDQIAANLENHIKALTVDIGERSVYLPANLTRTADYITRFYEGIGLSVERESYFFHNFEVSNVVTEAETRDRPGKRYLLGAHYDSVSGTVGADDNGSAVAVQLEVARILTMLKRTEELNIAIKIVSFALEEPPAFLIRYRGSRVHARKARRINCISLLWQSS